jgi:methylated-DNA-[protein]-cysteine S-methyltransferase
MILDTGTVATPLGPLTVVVDDGTVRAASFTDSPEALRPRLAAHHRRAELRAVSDLGPVTRAVRAYFDGDPRALEELPVEQPGNQYFQAAWRAMREIPAGSTVSYRDLAGRVGDAATARAAGFACARNQVVLIVPCHRVVRTGGALGDYYYGLDVKAWLLRHEGVDVGLPLEVEPPLATAGAAARQAVRARRAGAPGRTLTTASARDAG